MRVLAIYNDKNRNRVMPTFRHNTHTFDLNRIKERINFDASKLNGLFELDSTTRNMVIYSVERLYDKCVAKNKRDSLNKIYNCFIDVYNKYFGRQDSDTLSMLSYYCVDKNEFHEDIYNYCIENIDNKNLKSILRDSSTNTDRLLILDKAKIVDSILSQIKFFYNFDDFEEMPAERILKNEREFSKFIGLSCNVIGKVSTNAGIALNGISKLTHTNDNYIEIINEIMGLRKEILAQRKKIEPDSSSYNYIDHILFKDPAALSRLYNLLGKEAFVQAFSAQIKKITKVIDLFGDNIQKNGLKFPPQKLIEAINPQASNIYNELENGIVSYKEKYKLATSDAEKIELIKIINTLTKLKRDLIDSSIKDPHEKLEIVTVYKKIWDNNPEEAMLLDKYLTQKDKSDKKEYYRLLNNFFWDSLGISKETLHPNTISKLDFSESKHLPAMFLSDIHYKNSFKNLVEILESAPEKDVAEIFNSLEENIVTKNEFKNVGINYDKWCTFNPAIKKELVIEVQNDSKEQALISKVANLLSEKSFGAIPDWVIEDIMDALYYAGYDFHNFSGKPKISKKDLSKVGIDDLKKILSIMQHVIRTKPFWEDNKTDSKFSESIARVKKNFAKISKEVNSYKNVVKRYPITIQKVDMNDIPKSMFLGDESSCCTSVKGFFGRSAPAYIYSKAVNAIEIKNGDKVIGNTMCYIVDIDDQPCLLLDNIEVKPPFNNFDEIRDGVIDVAKKIVKDIGKPDMDIYAGSNTQKVDMKNFSYQYEYFSFLGAIKSAIFIDTLNELRNPSREHRYSRVLYKLT